MVSKIKILSTSLIIIGVNYLEFVSFLKTIIFKESSFNSINDPNIIWFIIGS